MTTDTLVIGAGLSGLHAASLLQQAGRSFQILEARPEPGGRIRTVHCGGLAVELGPSWFWPEANPRVASLVEKHGLQNFPQHTSGDALIDRAGMSLQRLPHASIDPRHSRRLTGGSDSLFRCLMADLPEEAFHYGHQVEQVSRVGEGVEVSTVSVDGPRVFRAQTVITALPLRLLAESVKFSPALPEPVENAFLETPTWMAGEAKFVAVYENPFWREAGHSGSAFSEGEVLGECHDASRPDGKAALLGFIRPGPDGREQLGEEALVAGALEQLTRYFGSAASSPQDTFLTDWFRQPLTATSSDRPLNGHPLYGLPQDARGLWEGALRFAGTEASSTHGGYLEGALHAAEEAVHA